MAKRQLVVAQDGSIRTSQVVQCSLSVAYLLDFLGRDNVLEVALGLIIGASFSGLVQSLTQDILLPPLSLLSPKSGNLASLFWVLRRGDTLDAVYNTREQAAADGISHTPIYLLILGATYLSYGVFIQKVVTLL